MSKEAIYWAKSNSEWRRTLKAVLMARYGDVCPLTGLEATDLAEVFVWRSDYPFPSRQRIIFVEENCLPVHYSINMDQSKADTAKMADILIKRVGREKIERWLSANELTPRVSLAVAKP